MTTSNESRPISTSRTRSSRSSSRNASPPAPVSPAPASPAPSLRVGTLILGVDPGSRATGYGLLRLEGSRIRYERSGTIVTRASLPFPDRLLHVHDALAGLLAEVDPDEVAVESAFVRPNSKSAFAALQIGHVRGVVLLAARRSRASIFEYTAPEVKLAVARQGAAAKEQVMFMVRRLLPDVDRVTADEADALAVALCHAHRAPARSLSILPVPHRHQPKRTRSDR